MKKGPQIWNQAALAHSSPPPKPRVMHGQVGPAHVADGRHDCTCSECVQFSGVACPTCGMHVCRDDGSCARKAEAQGHFAKSFAEKIRAHSQDLFANFLADKLREHNQKNTITPEAAQRFIEHHSKRCTSQCHRCAILPASAIHFTTTDGLSRNGWERIDDQFGYIRRCVDCCDKREHAWLEHVDPTLVQEWLQLQSDKHDSAYLIDWAELHSYCARPRSERDQDAVARYRAATALTKAAAEKPAISESLWAAAGECYRKKLAIEASTGIPHEWTFDSNTGVGVLNPVKVKY